MNEQHIWLIISSFSLLSIPFAQSLPPKHMFDSGYYLDENFSLSLSPKAGKLFEEGEFELLVREANPPQGSPSSQAESMHEEPLEASGMCSSPLFSQAGKGIPEAGSPPLQEGSTQGEAPVSSATASEPNNRSSVPDPEELPQLAMREANPPQGSPPSQASEKSCAMLNEDEPLINQADSSTLRKFAKEFFSSTDHPLIISVRVISMERGKNNWELSVEEPYWILRRWKTNVLLIIAKLTPEADPHQLSLHFSATPEGNHSATFRKEAESKPFPCFHFVNEREIPFFISTKVITNQDSNKPSSKPKHFTNANFVLKYGTLPIFQLSAKTQLLTRNASSRSNTQRKKLVDRMEEDLSGKFDPTEKDLSGKFHPTDTCISDPTPVLPYMKPCACDPRSEVLDRSPLPSEKKGSPAGKRSGSLGKRRKMS